MSQKKAKAVRRSMKKAGFDPKMFRKMKREIMHSLKGNSLK